MTTTQDTAGDPTADAIHGPDLPTGADLDAARDRVAGLLRSGTWDQFVAAQTAYEDTFTAWAAGPGPEAVEWR